MPPASSKSHSTSARSRDASSADSAARISIAALALLSDRASTRSTGDSPARTPARVSRYPTAGSARRMAPSAHWSRGSSLASRQRRV